MWECKIQMGHAMIDKFMSNYARARGKLHHILCWHETGLLYATQKNHIFSILWETDEAMC